MKGLEFKLIRIIEDYVDDYGVEATLEELFPGVSLGELVYDMYSAGLIPEDVLERFLTEE